MIMTSAPARLEVNWLLLWSKFGWLDIIFIIAVVLGLILGLRKGLAKIFPGLIEVAAAQVVALEYSRLFADFLSPRVPVGRDLLEIAIFLGLALGSIILIHIIFKLLGAMVTVDFKPPLSGIGGAIANAARFALLLGLISTFLVLIPLPFVRDTVTSRSVSGPLLIDYGKKIHHYVHPWLPKTWQAPKKTR